MQRLEDDFIDSILEKYGKDISKLNLSNNGLTCIRNIDRLGSSLTSLNLANNDLVDIRPLAALSSLRELNLAQNSMYVRLYLRLHLQLPFYDFSSLTFILHLLQC